MRSLVTIALGVIYCVEAKNATTVIVQKTNESIRHLSEQSAGTKAKVGLVPEHAPMVHASDNSTHGRADAPMKQAVFASKAQNLSKSIKDLQDEVQEKEGDLKVQRGLAEEKEKEDDAAKKETAELKVRADHLQREAQVAADLAMEKSDAFAKVSKEEASGEANEKNLQAEASETQKFLTQTQAEERDLEEKLASLRKEEEAGSEAAKDKSPKKGSATPSAAAATTVLHKKAAVTMPPLGHGASMKNPASSDTMSAVPNAEEVKRLLEENKRLQLEKEQLVSQLNAKKAASEQAKLKQKLKARLLDVDRHVVLKKSRKL